MPARPPPPRGVGRDGRPRRRRRRRRARVLVKESRRGPRHNINVWALVRHGSRDSQKERVAGNAQRVWVDPRDFPTPALPALRRVWSTWFWFRHYTCAKPDIHHVSLGGPLFRIRTRLGFEESEEVGSERMPTSLGLPRSVSSPRTTSAARLDRETETDGRRHFPQGQVEHGERQWRSGGGAPKEQPDRAGKRWR